jgi:hypothetical protein
MRGDVDRASLYIDGQLKCERGPCRVSVPGGEHEVAIKRDGYKTFSRKVNVQPKTEVTIKPDLAEKPSRIDAIVAYTVGAALVGGGIWAGTRARGLRDDLRSEVDNGPTPANDDPRFNRAKFFSVGSDAALAIGGVALVTAVWWTFRDKGAPSEGRTDIRNLSMSPNIGPGYAGLGMGVNF